MEVCFKNTSLTKSNKNEAISINKVESRTNKDINENVTEAKALVNNNINIIKNESMNDIKYLDEYNEKNLKKIKSLEKPNENNNKYLNLEHSVKSKYIIKKIFQNLNEKIKLLLIRYNKFYNKLLRIDIEHYKKISGKIKIGESNGYGKVYDLNSLALDFEGYYKNGKRDGEGKEYISNILRFEGEYRNGKRNGKGIEYNKDGKLVFEGEYIDGKNWKGKIIEYASGNLKFEGEYLNGKKIGKEYDKDGKLKFEGEYLDDKRWNGIIYNKNNNSLFKIENGNGKVEEYNEDGELIFEGEYINVNGKRWNGKLKEYSDGMVDKGSWRRCRCCGNKSFEMNRIYEKVKEYKNILKFEGEYLNGKRNGKGKEYDVYGK